MPESAGADIRPDEEMLRLRGVSRRNEMKQLATLFIPLQQSGNPACSGHPDVSHFWKVMALEALMLMAEREGEPRHRAGEICFSGCSAA